MIQRRGGRWNALSAQRPSCTIRLGSARSCRNSRRPHIHPIARCSIPPPPPVDFDAVDGNGGPNAACTGGRWCPARPPAPGWPPGGPAFGGGALKNGAAQKTNSPRCRMFPTGWHCRLRVWDAGPLFSSKNSVRVVAFDHRDKIVGRFRRSFDQPAELSGPDRRRTPGSVATGHPQQQQCAQSVGGHNP